MRADSAGLETEVYMSRREIKELENSFLAGEINFREYEDNKTRRKIPFKIVHDKFQADSLNVHIIPPKTYFGDAKEIIFAINSEFYNNLASSGRYGDRFCGSGKLLIFS